MQKILLNIAFFSALLAAISGCQIAMSRCDQMENLIPQPSLECSLASATTDSFFIAGDWPSERWWEIFGSEELNELIETALAQNYTIDEFFARMEIAKQETRIAKSKLYPLIYFKAQDTWEYLSENGLYRALNPNIPLNANLIDLSLSFSYEFDFWGKNRNLIQAAIGERSAKTIEIFQTELMVSTSIAQAYFALKTNLERKNFYKKYYEIKKSVLETQNLNREAALLSKLPLLVSQQNVIEAHQLLLGIEDEIERNRHLINYLLGRGPDCQLNVGEDFLELPENVVIPCDLSLSLLARRPDLMAQIWRVNALAYEVGAAMADFYPDISLTGLIGLESTSLSKLLQSSSKTAMMQPALSLPIFTAGSIQANVMAKKAAFDEAVFSYNDLILKSAQEVADFLSLAKTAYLQLQDQKRVVENEREIYRLISLRRKSGLEGILPYYDIGATLIEEELQLSTLRYDVFSSVVKLIKSLGGGYFSPCIPLEAECCP